MNSLNRQNERLKHIRGKLEKGRTKLTQSFFKKGGIIIILTKAGLRETTPRILQTVVTFKALEM